MEILWDLFGGTINSKGYKVLDSHIGCIYGDAITLKRAEEIYTKLINKGFSVENVALGVGSYSLQYVTRDTFGFAMKATHLEYKNNEFIALFKDPITSKDTVKKSPKGMCYVYKIGEQYHLIDNFNSESIKLVEYNNQLETVFKNGVIMRKQSLKNIRNILHSYSGGF